MDLNDEIKDTYDIVAEIGSGGGGILHGCSLKGGNLTIYYSGMGGIALAVIGLIVLSPIFKR